MQRDTKSRAVQLNKEHRRRKSWLRVVTGMAAVVVFVTTYALILPAITMEQKTVCGLEEHTHGTGCFAKQQHSFTLENCSWEGHHHEADCFDESGEPCCGYADTVLHRHSGLCYDDMGQLICEMEECEEHIHDESCCEVQESWLCGRREGEGSHRHDETCYGERTVICDLEEGDEHTHDDACYAEGEL